MGEHTDYNGIPVLPMTIDRAIYAAACRLDEPVVRMWNLEARYEPAAFPNSAAIQASPAGSWHNYGKAAVQALNTHFGITDYPGMAFAVGSTLPTAAGLSSSTAMVIAVALAYLRCLGKQLDAELSRGHLAALLAEGEQYVGTQGGGMDQAIILLGKEGAASKIDFFPLRTEDVPLLPHHQFVVCNSFIRAEKTGEARHRYNEGPVTCRLICAMVEKYLRDRWDDRIVLNRLGDLWQGHLCLTHNEVDELFLEIFPFEHVSLARICRFLGMSEADVRARWLRNSPEPPEGFRLKARARHQLREYQRVEMARDALLLADADLFGELMDASHQSCALDYGVSCPELDMLVAAARAAGAVGARLTGAGFGGCTVNLVPRDEVAEFGRRLDQTFYVNNPEPDRCIAVTSVMGASYLLTTEVASNMALWYDTEAG